MKYDARFAAHTFNQLTKEKMKRSLTPEELRYCAIHMEKMGYADAAKVAKLAHIAETLPMCANLHRLTLDAAISQLQGEERKLVKHREVQNENVDYMKVLGFYRTQT